MALDSNVDIDPAIRRPARVMSRCSRTPARHVRRFRSPCQVSRNAVSGVVVEERLSCGIVEVEAAEDQGRSEVKVIAGLDQHQRHLGVAQRLQQQRRSIVDVSKHDDLDPL